MQVTFKEIHIKYYKSITSASLYYYKGIWHIKGINNDAFGSNGSGKSTMLEALQQCLYNRTVTGNTLETTVNRKTGKSYDITVLLSTSDGEEYLINNNRSAMKVTIKKLTQGEYIDVGARSIPSALTYIQNLIGLDFNAFVALTHVTNSTVVSMLDNFTGSNLLKVLLDFGLIQKYEKALKDSLSNTKKTLDTDMSRGIEISKSLDIINSFKPAEIAPLYVLLSNYTTKLEEIIDKYNCELDEVRKKEYIANKSKSKLLVDIDNLKHILDTSVCKTCGTDLKVSKGIKEEHLLAEKEVLEKELNAVNNELLELSKEINNIHDTTGNTVGQLREQVKNLRTKIDIQEYNTEMFNKSSASLEELNKELVSINTSRDTKLETLDVIQSALSIIKQGKLHEEMLNEFCRLLNVYLKELLPYVSLTYLDIHTKHSKNSFDFVVEDLRYNTQINPNELSGGELTRVRLVVLISMLKTVQVMTNTSLNLLIFDEALDTLDTAAAEDLAHLFKYLSETENKFIAMVSHGQQLNAIEFTGTINVIKTEGTSKVFQEVVGDS